MTSRERPAFLKHTNMKPKTIKWWLNTLPEPLRSAAIKARKQKHNPLYLLKHATSLKSSIASSFIWHWTDEGYDFWQGFYQNLVWAEELDEKDRLSISKDSKRAR